MLQESTDYLDRSILTHRLILESCEPSPSSKLTYLAEKAALFRSSVFSIVKTASKAFFSLKIWQQAKNFSIEQMQKASRIRNICLSCLPSIISSHLIEPKETLTPQILDWTIRLRNWRVIQETEWIEKKLQTQYARAQNQAALESDKEFQYLSAPESFKGQAHTEEVSGYEVGVCHFIGRRPTMEDEHLATAFDLNIQGEIYPVQLFGIFDGHGGSAASIYVKQNLEKELHETLLEFCERELNNKNIWNALKITFAKLNTKFLESQSGTTATVAMILDGNLWTANVGDSRTILDNGIQLSEDAKPSDPYYKKGIENRGGKVYFNRINGMLAVARAVGDHNVGAVNPRPKITVYPLSMIPERSHLILTCDGIYDVSSTRQIAKAVQSNKEQSPEELAKNIVYSAFQARSGDNLSALVVKL